ncbi:hypothetical protein M422DRAFT_253127 [Sphaerobolus stellatus SS14]|uniref:Uncharacterized protein n=1 Tax=Sphaerobolus stellatus (strain SS14) TaxID=990650 RepID=A0A0C9V990_SPHS4|nr:hypothetical protein M422DRAFT_253127 [Sphaerobolus stellatus SS14]
MLRDVFTFFTRHLYGDVILAYDDPQVIAARHNLPFNPVLLPIPSLIPALVVVQAAPHPIPNITPAPNSGPAPVPNIAPAPNPVPAPGLIPAAVQSNVAPAPVPTVIQAPVHPAPDPRGRQTVLTLFEEEAA